MPDVFDHGSGRDGLMECWVSGLMRNTGAGINPTIHVSNTPFRKWSARQDLHLRSLGPKPSALAATLRADGGLEGSCTLNPPADNGALCWLSYESEMVGGAGNAPVVTSDSCF